MANPLDQVTELIKKTGDTVIVLDSSGQVAYVLMDFKRYQSIVSGRPEVVGLSEEEMLGKINRDIALWKATNDEDASKFEQLENAIFQMKSPVKNPNSEGLMPLFPEENSLDLAKNTEKEDSSGETEEKYYFEPID